MTPLAIFLASLVADYGSSLLAISRGLREGNPIFAVSPLWIGLASAAVVIGLGEFYRRKKARGWQGIFYAGAGVHAAATVWNTVLIILKGAN